MKIIIFLGADMLLGAMLGGIFLPITSSVLNWGLLLLRIGILVLKKICSQVLSFFQKEFPYFSFLFLKKTQSFSATLDFLNRMNLRRKLGFTGLLYIEHPDPESVISLEGLILLKYHKRELVILIQEAQEKASYIDIRKIPLSTEAKKELDILYYATYGNHGYPLSVWKEEGKNKNKPEQ